MSKNIDLWILCIYLVITFVIGTFFIKDKYQKDVKQFSIGDANYSKIVLTASIVAVWLSSSSFINSIAESYSYGIIMFFVFCGSIVSFLISSKFIVPIMHHFYGMVSLAEIMQHFYGNYGRIITAISAAIYMTGFFVLNMLAISSIIGILFVGVEKYILVTCCCGIVVFYSAFGGIRAITATDIFQIILIVITIPLIGNIALHQVGGMENLLQQTSETHLKLFSHEKSWSMLAMFLVLCIPDMDPSFTQRFLMNKDTRKVTSALYASCIAAGICLFISTALGLISSVIYPDIETPKLILQMFIRNMLPNGLSGLVIIGMLSLCMSTADSRLNTAVVLIVNDMIIPIIKLLKMKIPSDKQKVFLLKVVSCIIGIIAMLFTLYFKDARLLSVFIFFVLLWGPFITIPLLMALFGFKHNVKIFIANVITATIFIVCIQAFGLLKGYDEIKIIIGMTISLITVLTCYIIQYREFPRPDPKLKFKPQYS